MMLDKLQLPLIIALITLLVSFFEMDPGRRACSDWRDVTINGIGPFATRETITRKFGEASSVFNDGHYSWKNQCLVLRKEGSSWHLMGLSLEHAQIKVSGRRPTLSDVTATLGKGEQNLDTPWVIRYVDPKSQVELHLSFSTNSYALAYAEWIWPEWRHTSSVNLRDCGTAQETAK